MVRAGGGIIVGRDIEGQLVFAIVHRARYDDWSFPKGKLELQETVLEGAIREVREETGLNCRPISFLSTLSYPLQDGITKENSYWLFNVEDKSETSIDDEVDQVRWLNLQDCMTLLSYESERGLLSDTVQLITNVGGAITYRIR